MKNYLIFFICTITISFSCEKEKNSSAISSARQELLQLSSSSLQREKFISFSSEEQAQVWKNKLEQVLSQTWLTQDQHSHILQGIQVLSSEVFKEGSNSQKNFKNEFEPKWRAEGTKLFTFDQFRQIVTSIEDFHLNDFSEKIIVPIEGEADDFDCACSETSDWCSWSDCEGRCHLGTSRGCGTFWSYACDGVCVG